WHHDHHCRARTAAIAAATNPESVDRLFAQTMSIDLPGLTGWLGSSKTNNTPPGTLRITGRKSFPLLFDTDPCVDDGVAALLLNDSRAPMGGGGFPRSTLPSLVFGRGLRALSSCCTHSVQRDRSRREKQTCDGLHSWVHHVACAESGA